MATPRIPATPNGSAFNEFDLKHCFDATLEFLNNWRQHSGLPIMKAWLASDPGSSSSCLLANALDVIALDPNHKLYERTSEHVNVGYIGDSGESGEGFVNNVSLNFPSRDQAERFVAFGNDYVGDPEAFKFGYHASNEVKGPAWMAVIAIAFDDKNPNLNDDLFRGENYARNEAGDFHIPTNITAIEASTGHGDTASA